MAQLNITLNQDEILQLMSGDREGAFAMLLQDSLNAILKAESAEQLNAESYERTNSRTGYRNGTRERELNTRIGTITLQVPRHRGSPFKSMIFDNYCRSEAALIASISNLEIMSNSSYWPHSLPEALNGRERAPRITHNPYLSRPQNRIVDTFPTNNTDTQYRSCSCALPGSA